MNKLFLLVFCFLAFSTLVAAQEHATPIYVFHSTTCPHCIELLDFLDGIKDKYPSLEVKEFEIHEIANNNLFQQLTSAYGQEVSGVPVTFIGEKMIVGYATFMAPEVEGEITYCVENGCVDPIEKLVSTPVQPEVEQLTIPAVILAAAVDAINPCAFAVLILLITAVLASGNRRRALLAGLAFTLAVYLAYFAMGLGLFSVIQASGLSQAFYYAVAILAIFVGLFNLKDYFWYGKWFIMEVPLSWRPRMKKIISRVTSIPGAFFAGLIVSLFLLPCTSGPYIVILGLLAKATSRDYAFMLLVLYNLIFVLPMLLITLGIYFGFTTSEQAEDWRKNKLKTLHLIAGVLMLLLGVGMIASIYLGWF
ncbi:MAG: cytochrome c biogenesis protein CcdA [Candidatus Micrarchaeota archaeon]